MAYGEGTVSDRVLICIKMVFPRLMSCRDYTGASIQGGGRDSSRRCMRQIRHTLKYDFGEYINECVSNDAHSYVLRLIEDAVRNRKLLPCLIFDNADHYEERFQEAVFQWSQSIRREVPFSFVIMPITDRTIWRLSKSGPFQTYRSKLFYLPVPSAREVLERRISFLIEKTNRSKGPSKSISWLRG